MPLATGYGAAVALRNTALRVRWGQGSRLPAPAVAVGNVVVGGTGKTPIASWIAQWYARRGLRPGILLRGYGGDERMVHRANVPEAIVIEHPQRRLAARDAVAGGAEVLVLDDALQRRDVRADLTIALLNTEWSGTSPWLLPAGPWRESRGALRRADLVVVTTRPPEEPRRLEGALHDARRVGRPLAVAELRLAGLERLCSRTPVDLETLRGRRVLAATGIAHPAAFARQLEALGARVRLVAWRDHARIGVRRIARLARAARAEVDYVVLTAKDAAKVRTGWPRGVPEPLVAALAVVWSHGQETVERALYRVVGRGR